MPIKRDEKAFQKKSQEIFKVYVKIRREKKENPSLGDMEAAGVTKATVEYYWKSLTNLEKEAIAKFPNLYDQGHRVGQRKNRKEEVLQEYIAVRKTFRKELTQRDITELKNPNLTNDLLQNYFGGITGVAAEARKQYPEAFHDIPLEDVIKHPEHKKKIKDWIDGYKRFFVTTAVMGCDVDANFYKSIMKYCEDQDAKLLVLTCADPAKRQASWSSLGHVDKVLEPHLIPFEVALNSNIFISTIKLSAKHIDPITGLDRIGQRDGSFIYASPKQRLKATPVSNNKYPHFLMTTGAITKSDYDTDMYMSERTGYIANHDHVMGGVIVEIVDDKVYHFRQVQADANGRFIDLGTEYSPKGKKSIRPAAFVLGDWHSGDTCPKARATWEEITRTLKPEYLVLHDAFDGKSINHHEMKNTILRSHRAQEGELDLLSELVGLRDDLEALAQLVDQVVVVKSNHDEFLDRYLKDGMYTQDPYNHKTALRLALAMLEGEDPLRWGVEEMVGMENKDKVRWLSRDEDFFIAKIQLGAHGDKGANGSRGSLQSMEKSYGNSVTGHSHSPEILRGAWQVGTSSLLKLSYNVGPSSWLNTSCLVYPNGARQLINMIDGKWRL